MDGKLHKKRSPRPLVYVITIWNSTFDHGLLSKGILFSPRGQDHDNQILIKPTEVERSKPTTMEKCAHTFEFMLFVRDCCTDIIT
jgi:hypothetical protein